MKFIFTLFVCVAFALVGRSQSSTFTATSVQNGSEGGPSWGTTFPSPVNLTNGNPISRTLIARFDFATLPANITIQGFTVTITRFAEAGTPNVTESVISLVKGSTAQGDNKAGSTVWSENSAAPTVTTYGGSTDLWGLTWTPAEITNANFGVAVRATRTGSGGAQNATVQSVSLTVHYLILAPIILTSFDVSKTAENFVNIQFATSTEENVKNIYVERSSDARNFSTIFTITPVGARNKYTKYNLIDKTPLTGMNYYRLKEIDIDGNVSYFDIKGISIARAGARFQAFYSGADIKVNLSGIKGDYVLSLHDASGAQISSQALKIMSNSFQTTVPTPQRAGVYIVTLKGEGINETARIFIGK